jgi:hypothetical protein
MKIRSELNALAADIRATATSWNGDEKIKIGDTESTITSLAKNVLEKLNLYLKEEKSLKGCIDTVQHLVNALNGLRDKSLNPDREKSLISTVREATRLLDSATQKMDLERKFLEKSLNHFYDEMNKFLGSLIKKIKEGAFRTIKNIGFRDQKSTNILEGSIQMASFLSLKQDLEHFVSSYGESLTEQQRSQIAETLPMLQSGADLDGKVVYLKYLSVNGVADEVIEAQIADLAYEIETSIEKLEVGQSLIVPGGYFLPNEGHSVLYEIKRARDKEYHFSIFNTGMGAEFGQEFLTKSQILLNIPVQSRVPLFTDLPKEAVTDQKFLMDLMRFRIKSTPDQMNAVHQAILKQLTEKYLGKQAVREQHDLQTWGTCTFDSVAAFLEYQLPPSLFIPFQYDMMLRSRGDLNSLLSQGKESNVFDATTLDFIDKKSCETISEWKKKFEKYCNPTGDLAVARYMYEKKIHDEKSLKETLELMRGQLLADCQNFGVYDQTRLPLAAGCFGIDRDKMDAQAEGTASIALESIAYCYGSLLTMLPKVIWNSGSESEEMRNLIQQKTILNRFQTVLERISPDQAAILTARNEDLSPSCLAPANRPSFDHLDLSHVFNYLKDRFAEIALCAPLLNLTASPLREALQGCNRLPGLAAH